LQLIQGDQPYRVAALPVAGRGVQAVPRGNHPLQQIPERHRFGDRGVLQGGQGGHVAEQEAAGVQLPAKRTADQPELDRGAQDRAVPRHR